MNQGVTINHDLTGIAIAKVTLEYRGRFVPPNMQKVEIECEVYEAGGLLMVHTACPKCRHALRIDGRNKAIELRGGKRAESLNQTQAKLIGAELYVEPFECPWEMGGKDDHQHFGFGLCRLRLAYDGKVAKDA
jgi:hypothetical protein